MIFYFTAGSRRKNDETVGESCAEDITGDFFQERNKTGTSDPLINL